MNEAIHDEGQETTTVPMAVDVQAVDVGLLRANSPAEMIKQAEGIATPLADIIERQKLFVELGKDRDGVPNRHVRVEGWTTMLAMLGITAVEKSSKRIECELESPINGDMIRSTYFEVYIELRRIADGRVIGGASAECGGPDEMEWHFRPKNTYHFQNCPIDAGGSCTCSPAYNVNKSKIIVTYATVQPNARRSMAGTRATSKAARLSFSWIINLAGFKTTPAEEMTGQAFGESADRPKHEQSTRQGQKQSPPAQKKKQGPPADYKRMNARFNSSVACPICGAFPEKGEEIAYRAGEPAMHWTCHEISQNDPTMEAPAAEASDGKDSDLPF